MNRVEPYTKSEEHRTTDALESDIKSTRERMDKTLDTISSKLNPERHIENAGDWVKNKIDSVDTDSMRDSAKHLGKKTGNIVRDHPLPVAFGALAIASMFVRKPTYDRKIEEPYIPGHFGEEGPTGTINPTLDQGVKQLPENSDNDLGNGRSDGKIAGAAHAVKDGLSTAAHKTGETLRSFGSSTRHTASRSAHYTGDKLSHGKDDYPAAMCLGAMALGFLAAFSLPRTRKENQICGERSDEFRHEIAEKSRQAVDETKETLREKKDEFVDKAKTEAEETLDQTKSTLDDKIEETGSAIDDKIDEEVNPG